MIIKYAIVFLFLLFNLCAKAQKVSSTWSLYTTETIRDNLENYPTLHIPIQFCDVDTGDFITIFNSNKVHKKDLKTFAMELDKTSDYGNYRLRNDMDFSITYKETEYKIFVFTVDFLKSTNVIASSVVFYNLSLGIVMKSYTIEYTPLYYFLKSRNHYDSGLKQQCDTLYLGLQDAILEVFNPM